ncbi:MAG: hypothetical protein JWO45_1820, partial [Spartobacteria bacterium]|nr:hypothetical protein [Spartobacteria bacterium]
RDGVTVTIGGPVAALVYTNNPNYSIAYGGNGSTTGTFGGAGATTSSLSGAPPFDPAVSGSTSSRTSRPSAATPPPRHSRHHTSTDPLRDSTRRAAPRADVLQRLDPIRSR